MYLSENKRSQEMPVSVDRYSTSKFILKDDEAVGHIKSLVRLLQHESNLSSGFLMEESYAKLLQCGDRTFKFMAGGYANSNLELRYSSIHNMKNEILEDDDPDYNSVSLFSEIQKNLQEGAWFFVENHSIEDYDLSSYIAIYHQDGRVVYRSSYDSKIDILKSINLEGVAR
jgi:hypothetical protein